MLSICYFNHWIIKEVINVWTKLILISHWHFFPVGYLEIFILFISRLFGSTVSVSLFYPKKLESVLNVGLSGKTEV